jgi:hypothetical protein
VYTLDAICGEIATRIEPGLRRALPPDLRRAWSTEWTAVAHSALVAASGAARH